MNTSKIEKSSKKIPWLAGLLGIQVILAVVLLNLHNRQPVAQNEALLAFDRAVLDKIEIISPDGKIDLHKKEGSWQIGNGLPALASRVDELLDEFAAIRSGWVVATTAEAATRFEVTEEKFRRKIHLRQGNTDVGALLLGTSPNFRHSHVRKPGDSEIYTVKLDEYSLPVDQESWLDNQLLRPTEDVILLQFGDHKIEKISGQWPARTPDAMAAVASDETGEAADASTGTTGFDSAAFANALAELTVLGVAKDPAGLETLSEGESALVQIQWRVATSAGEYDYQLLSKNDQYYIRRGDIPHTFKLSKAQYDALAQIQQLGHS
jgi:hypothetical protein